MEYLITGVSNKTLPIELREKMAVKKELIPGILSEMCANCGISEGMVISTCNRTEIHVAAASPDVVPALQVSLCNVLGLPSAQIQGCWYTHTGGNAVRHLFRVAAGLDSMIVGESQVFFQLKEAYQTAFASGATGHLINQILHRSFFVAKRVRTETGIGLGATSVSSVAVDIIEASLCQRYRPTIMIVGTGGIGAAAAKSIRDRNLGNLLLINRTITRAESLAAELGASVRIWEDLEDLLLKADAIITSCGGDSPILTQEMLERAMRKASRLQLTIIDLGVPRDVEPGAEEIPGLVLHNIDALQGIADRNKEERWQEVDHAEAIVAAEAKETSRTLLESGLEPTIASLMQKCEEIRKRELERAFDKLGDLTPEHRRMIEVCTTSIVGKILHDPIVTLKKSSSLEASAAPERKDRNTLSFFKNIFGLE